MIVFKNGYVLPAPTDDEMKVSISAKESDKLLDELIRRVIEEQRNIDGGEINRKALFYRILEDFNNPLKKVSHE